MMVFWLIIGSILAGDAGWWWWADRRLRRLPGGRRWRIGLGAFMGLELLGFSWLFIVRLLSLPPDLSLPAPLLMAVYLWHILVLPVAVFIAVCHSIGALAATAARQVAAVLRRTPPRQPESPARAWTRREVLAGIGVALPPLLTAGAIGASAMQRGQFRIRPLRIALPDLPPELEGLSIAHVTDVHVGRFTNGRTLDEIVRRTNELQADLVLMTGDLIDYALADLPAGLEMVKRLRSRYGLFMCEGNHDLIQGAEAFERSVKASGVPLLLDEATTLSIRGRAVQLLGVMWGRPRQSPSLDRHMNRIAALRDPDAFQILLAHHPHAFDQAADLGIPLTLAGHTHGGQLMLNERLGAGSVMFRYWSGLYRQGRSALVVSNGVGNWFPLRVNAPAEIIHLTLTRA